MQELRVYEFAKKIGIDTISLMDKLKEWDFSVKSHMATLDAKTMEAIKEKIEEEDSSKKKAKKKTSKKKTAKKKVASANTKKKIAKKKVVRTRKTSEETDPSIVSKDGSIKKIVRRKKESLEEKARLEAAEAEAASKIQDAKQAVTKEEPSQEINNATEAVFKKKVPKNIVGKIDLAKVEAYAKTKQQARRAPATDRGSNASVHTSARRSPATTFIPDPEPLNERAGKKEKGRKKLARSPSTEERPKSPLAEEENTSFNRTDFRKRETIFQPKKKKVAGVGENKKTEITKPRAIKRQIKIEGLMLVSDVAKDMKIKPRQLVSHLLKEGMEVSINDELDFDTIALVAPEFDFEAIDERKTIADIVKEAQYGDLNAEPVARPPVVTVMGHVDHGKTSLLDAIRKADVASGEAGGITQHIGAYQVQLEDKKVVTFLDTPGHEAFTAMRARGATATDIAVIVIAADDGVMPQTAEAINHAKAAGVAIIIAVNKMDTQGANIEKIKQQVTEFELVPEEWGGSTMFIPTSAIEKQGISELIEAIHLQAEMLELKANPKRSARGIIIEAKQEKGRGIVATVLIQDGSLKKGDDVVAGSTYGRIKNIIDDKGKIIKEAGPGTPVEILGLNESPQAGDTFDACRSDKQAKDIAELRRLEKRQTENKQPSAKMTLEDLYSKVEDGQVKELPVVLKTDVSGSIEAIRQLFDKVSTAKVKVITIHYAVGGITESDVLLASSAGAILVGFNVRPDAGAKEAAKKEAVQIKSYSIIYELVDDIRNAMKGVLDPDIIEEEQGGAEVRELFKVPGRGTIAGCFVKSGKVHRDDLVRLLRDGKEIYKGKVDDLRRFKDTVKEVAEGYECGISIENYNDIKVGDYIEAYSKKEVAAELGE